MRKLVYYVGVSIDGYIAGPGGEVNFYPLADDMAAWINERYPETLPTHYRARLGVNGPNLRFDTVVMGLGTYKPALDHGIASPYAHLRQYVVSSTLGPVDDAAVKVVAGDPVGLVRELKREGGERDIWLCGGGKLASALLPEIDELIIKSYPVVAGAGIPVFGAAFQPTAFTPYERQSFSNGATVTWYRRAQPAA